MLKRRLIKSIIAVFIAVCTFLTLFVISANLVFAGGGSIALSNTYPSDRGTYLAVDRFLYKITAVNSNTTVSVSVDDGPQIPMTYQGVMNELVIDDTAARDWYTWQITIPVITSPGVHTFRFFSHYYVWQDADHYWAEFNACSAVQSFTIVDALSTSSQSPPPTRSPVYLIVALTSLPLAALLLFTLFVLRKRC